MEKIGIFLIHGITKTNKELESIKQRLEQNKNIKAYLPLLPGHGTCPYSNETCFKHFWKTTPKEWLAYSEKEFKAWKKDFKKIYIGGISLGGNISLFLAKKYKVNGIILFGTPMILSKFLSFTYFCSNIALQIINKINKKKNHKGQYHGLPIARLMVMKKFIDESKKDLKFINRPILIFHSKRDDISHPKSVSYILKNINSKRKEVVWINTEHGINPQSQREVKFIANKIINFVNTS